jgi:anhydro-N-acetylmuramic acid kinase
MDIWVRTKRQLPYDRGGAWAASGRCHDEMLAELLNEPYFSLDPPKSTGRELFNRAWLMERMERSMARPPTTVGAMGAFSG